MSEPNTTTNKPCLRLLVPHAKAICNAWWDNPNNVWISGRHLLVNSKNMHFWSHIDFTPISFVVDGDKYVAESRNSFYDLVTDPDYDPKSRQEKHRYLPPLRDVKVTKVEYTDLITGFDEGCNDTIEAELLSETEDYYEVYLKAWSKRSGRVRYLK